jgi:hypothetical protein
MCVASQIDTPGQHDQKTLEVKRRKKNGVDDWFAFNIPPRDGTVGTIPFEKIII